MATPKELEPFDVHGNLPEGVHYYTEEEFFRRFVQEFPSSRTRRRICKGFFRLREESLEHGIIATQWVDGSFVTSTINPRDVDVVTFLDYDALNCADCLTRTFIETHLHGQQFTVRSHYTHAMVVVACGKDHPYYRVYERARCYWRTWFGTTRDIPNPAGPDFPGHCKGIVAMTLGDPAMAPHIDEERRAG